MTTTIETFNAGLLLAIRVAGFERFNCWAPYFHDAYGAVIERLCLREDTPVVGLRWVKRDPLFGGYHAAENMILGGMRDHVIALESPEDVIATFLLNDQSAGLELDKYYTEISELRDYGRIFVDNYKGSLAYLTPLKK